MMLVCSTVMAQKITVADKNVAFTKNTTIAGSLGAELFLRKKQGDLIKELEDIEEDYDAKRNVFGNLKTNTIVIAAVETKLFFINQKIAELESKIERLKVASFGFGHGLSRYQDQLAIEKKYLQKLQEENILIGGGGMVFSGGTGHVYTAYLKLLIRLIKIKNNILIIDRDMAARNKIISTLEKLTLN